MKPELANVSCLRVNNVKTIPTGAAIHGQAISVSGYLYDFTKVGTAAKLSPRMLKAIAIFPTLVICHKTSPSMESAPVSYTHLTLPTIYSV